MLFHRVAVRQKPDAMEPVELKNTTMIFSAFE
jgi:hypothetical protein